MISRNPPYYVPWILDHGWVFYERGFSVILPPTNWFLYYTRRGHYYGFWTPVGRETAFPPNRNIRFTTRLGGVGKIRMKL